MKKFKCIACGTEYDNEEDAKMCSIMNDGFEEDELETIEKVRDFD